MDFMKQVSRRLATGICTNLYTAVCVGRRRHESGERGTPLDEKGEELHSGLRRRATLHYAEPVWTKRPETAGPARKGYDEIFYSDGEDDGHASQSEEEEDTEETESHELMKEPFTQPSSLPAQENSSEESGHTQPEEKPPQQRPTRTRSSQKARYKPWRMREKDCASYWNDLSLHGHIPRADRDMIMDRMRITRDQCTRAFFNNDTKRMERVTESNPTPLLDISIMTGNRSPRSFSCLPDSGTTKAIVSKDLAVKLGIRFAPVPFDHILTDSQGVAMNVEGMGVMLSLIHI